MNKVILVGRLVKDPEVKTTQSQIAFCGFTIAVDRKFKTASGERQADFISCVVWRQQAEFLGKYFQKGSRVAVVGNLQSRTFDDANGKKVYVTEVVVDEIEFVDGKKSDGSGETAHTGNGAVPAASAGPFPSPAALGYQAPAMDYPSMDDDTTLPFDL